MTYKSQQHKTIFEKAIKKKDKSNRILIASMYLLTADNKLWQIMQHHIEQNRIDFDDVKLSVITENAYTLYCAAKDMYFNTDFVSVGFCESLGFVLVFGFSISSVVSSISHIAIKVMSSLTAE